MPKGLVRKIVATTVVVSALALGAASIGMNAVKDNAMITVSSIQPPSSSASVGTGVASWNSGISPLQQPIVPAQIYNFLSFAAMNERDSGDESGDPDQSVSRAGIEQMVDEALPYIAREFGSEQVFRPLMTFTNSRIPNANTRGFYYLFGVHINGSPAKVMKAIVAHEYVHAQYPLNKSFAPWSIPKRVMEMLFSYSDSASPLNETFTQTVAWEVLANQALDGDMLAKAALLDNIVEGFEHNRRFEAGEKLSPNEIRYSQRPAQIVSEVITGKRTSYAGIELDGLEKLLRQEIVEVGTTRLIPEDAQLSDLQDYCNLEFPGLFCGSGISAFIEAKVDGRVTVNYVIGNNVRSSIPQTVKPDQQIMFYLPYHLEGINEAVAEGRLHQLPITLKLPYIIEPGSITLESVGCVPDSTGCKELVSWGALNVSVQPGDSYREFYVLKTGELVPISEGGIAATLAHVLGKQAVIP